MIVRRLGADEAMVLRTIRLRALTEAPDAFARTHAEISAKPDSYWEEMTRSLTEPGRHVMASGTAQSETPEVPHLGGMWVDPGVRARGIGRALTGAVIDWARERGFSRIALWVTEGNGAAGRLYARMGFKPTGRTDRLPANADLGIVEMERAL